MNPSRILYVTSCWPHDRAYGGQIRALHIGRALQHFGRPTLVVVGADPVDRDCVEKTKEEFDLGRVVGSHVAPPRGISGRVRSLLDSDFTNIHGVVADRADEAWLIEASARFDLIWFFKLRTANYFTQARWPHSVADIDDLPSSMEKRLILGGASLREQLRAKLRFFELRRHERRLQRRFDVLSVCSESDRSAFAENDRVHVIPNGCALPAKPSVRKRSQPPRIGFMGLFGYQPNLDGVRWFMEYCWPRIQRERPGVRLRLVGKDSDGPLKPADPSVDGLGWIEDPGEEVASWNLMIVPIRMGGGTRIKIADAFSRRCPLVSTRFGALGYEVQSGRELLLADDPGEFAAACLSLIADPPAAETLAERAYSTFLQKWTWEAIAPRVWKTAEDCLRLQGSGPMGR